MLEGFDLLVVVGILLILFLYSPAQLPKIARSLGEAKREWEPIKKEVHG